MLPDLERAVGEDADVDGRVGKAVLVGGGRGGEGKRDGGRGDGRDQEPPGSSQVEKETRGAARAASSISKYCFGEKLNMLAKMFVGTDSIAVSYVSTVSL